MDKEKRYQLIEDGYCCFPKILDSEILEKTRQVSGHLINRQKAGHFEAQKSTGSMISVYDDPFFAELIAYPKALFALKQLGYADPRWSSGYIISKPAHSPPLFWHQDWWGWNDPISYTKTPQQLFLMYYLVDTSQQNGCLRVIKGSHLKRHPLHISDGEAHTANWSRYSNPEHPIYQSVAEEVAVPASAGDLIIGDSRLIHGAYANESDKRRTVITLWYHPEYSKSPESIRAHLSRKQSWVSRWPLWAQKQVQNLVPDYSGDCEPLTWNRNPNYSYEI